MLLVTGWLLLTGLRPGTLPFNPGAPFSDAATSHFPAADFLRERMVRDGTFPHWRDAILGGQPFAANPLNKVAYPPQWLVLLLPPALHLNLLVGLHLLVAGWGMWRWTRALGLVPAAAAVSTLAFVIAPRLSGHLGAGHVDLVYALAWFPWLLWSVHAAVRGPQRPYFHIVRTGLIAGLLVLADVRLSLFAFGVAAVYAVYLVGVDRRAGRLGPLVLASIPFALLTLSVSVPLALWRPFLTRAGLNPGDASVFSLEPGLFLGLLLPQHEGSVESLTYVGLSVLVLALVGVATRPRTTWLWLLIALGAAWYALGENGLLWTGATRVARPLVWFRVPARAWFVIALIAPLLAGYGAHTLLTMTQTRQRGRLRLLALAGLVGALACGAFTLLSLPVPPSVGVGVLLGGVGVTLVIALALSGVVRAARLAAALLLVVALDLGWSGLQWLEWRGPDQWLDPQRPLAEQLVMADAVRVYSPTYSLAQEVAHEYDIDLFYGVDPFQLEIPVDAIQRAGGVITDSYSVIQPPLLDIDGVDAATANRAAVIDTDLLADWNVSHVIAAYPLEHPGLTLTHTLDNVYIYTNDAFTIIQHNHIYLPDGDRLAWPPRWGRSVAPGEFTALLTWGYVALVIALVTFGVCLVQVLYLSLRRTQKAEHD